MLDFGNTTHVEVHWVNPSKYSQTAVAVFEITIKLLANVIQREAFGCFADSPGDTKGAIGLFLGRHSHAVVGYPRVPILLLAIVLQKQSTSTAGVFQEVLFFLARHCVGPLQVGETGIIVAKTIVFVFVVRVCSRWSAVVRHGGN